MIQSSAAKKNVFLQNFVNWFPHHHISATVLSDEGSYVSLITDEMAGFMGLKRGRKTHVNLHTTGNREPQCLSLFQYNLTVPTNDSQEVNVTLQGVPHITENSYAGVSVEPAYHLFPHVPKGTIKFPQEPVHILLGQDHAGLLPTIGDGMNKV